MPASSRCNKAATTLLLAALAFHFPASAYATDANADSGDRVEWKDEWYPAQWWELGGAVGLLAIGVRTINATTDWSEPWWGAGWEVDHWIRQKLVARSNTGVKVADYVSDIPFIGLRYYPIIVDSLLVGWFVHGDEEVALNTGIIGLSALAISSFTLFSMRLVTMRERPRFLADNCEREPSPRGCGPRNAVSFPSGHTAISFTGAGMICAVHEEIPLYGGGFWDDFACGAALSLSAMGFVLRIVSNKHYFTDNLVGTALGLASGYIFPKLVHFGGLGDDASEEASYDVRLMPAVHGDGPGLSLDVRF